MLWLICTTGLLNFAVGYALALWWQRHRRLAMEPSDAQAAPVAKDESPVFNGTPPPQPEPVAEETIEVIPSEWVDLLSREAIVARTLVEASAQVLRLEVGRYREQLLQIEEHVRKLLEAPSVETASGLRDQLSALNHDWLVKQNQAAEHLGARSKGEESFDEVRLALEATLAEQQTRIEAACGNLASIDMTEQPVGCRRMLAELLRLIDLAHALRDRIYDCLSAILDAENGLDNLETRLQVDPQTGLYNRNGLERIFRGWRQADPRGERLLSAVLIDIDRFAALNSGLGARAGDQLLSDLGHYIGNVIRKNRGFDRIARHNAASFFVLLGDTGPRGAAVAAERIRQTIEAGEFDLGEHTVELSACCGVTEIRGQEDVREAFARTAAAVRRAKEAGRNCTWIDDGEGPQPVGSLQHAAVESVSC